MSWWQSTGGPLVALLRQLVGAVDADAEDAARGKRRKAAARRAGEIAAEAERQAQEARSRARKCAACLGTGCRFGRECDVCGGSGVG